METLDAEFNDYLARSYQEGVLAGFQMAIGMAEKVIPLLTSEEQRGAITGLVESLRKVPYLTSSEADKC
ncbi:hypothetical protein [Mycobacterium gordonae]|uniref:Uncharacterized protein n=1 Tax=Mycobacterium gordonae TaxID=1778 RepID=A0A1X1XCQ4_MYCGO|nr:hypothetical protein [Mycobacterium gordonae]MCV7009364.1 hypothetical protein [Mycobacterium gordonae]ODR15944.1 hypothetical protein BHQ23_31725 [Mycobacterium gordonae]ORV96677.1 hypothetical protein AWC08_12155 [Mycobacterium gordonae]